MSVDRIRALDEDDYTTLIAMLTPTAEDEST